MKPLNKLNPRGVYERMPAIQSRPVIVIDPETGIPYGPPRDLPTPRISSRDLREARVQHRNETTGRAVMGKIPEALKREVSDRNRQRPQWLTAAPKQEHKEAPKDFTPADPRLAPEPRFYTWPGRRPVY